MVRYIIRRLVGVFLTLVVISMVTFGLFFAVPANPAELSCGKGCTPENVAKTERKLELDLPVWQQYGRFVKGLVSERTYGEGGELRTCAAPCIGLSFSRDEPVRDLIQTALPVTLSLTLGAAVFWLLIGVTVGVLSALKPRSIFDRLAMVGALAGYSLPTFFTGLMVLIFVVIKWKAFPYPGYSDFTENPLLWARGLLLPWLVLAFAQAALYARLTRANMMDTMSEDYIRTARAKGLKESVVVRRHGMRAALTPIVTIFGLDLGALLGGAILTEQVFNLNGIGRLLVRSVLDLDLPVIVGVTLLAAFFIVMSNLIVDVLYAVIDPKVRLS